MVQNSRKDHLSIAGERLLQYWRIRLMPEWNMDDTLSEGKHDNHMYNLRHHHVDPTICRCDDSGTKRAGGRCFTSGEAVTFRVKKSYWGEFQARAIGKQRVDRLIFCTSTPINTSTRANNINRYTPKEWEPCLLFLARRNRFEQHSILQQQYIQSIYSTRYRERTMVVRSYVQLSYECACLERAVR